MVTLDLDVAIGNVTAGRTGALESLEDVSKVRRIGIKAGDDGDGLSLLAFFSTNAHLLIFGKEHFAVRLAWAGACVNRRVADTACHRAFE